MKQILLCVMNSTLAQLKCTSPTTVAQSSANRERGKSKLERSARFHKHDIVLQFTILWKSNWCRIAFQQWRKDTACASAFAEKFSFVSINMDFNNAICFRHIEVYGGFVLNINVYSCCWLRWMRCRLIGDWTMLTIMIRTNFHYVQN